MLYFHLNKTNFIDPIFMGQKNNIGDIEMSFHNVLKSFLPNVKCYTESCSNNPQFADVPKLNGKNWLLMSIDDEDMNVNIDVIRDNVEKVHSVMLTDIGKSFNDMGLHYDFIVWISNKEVNRKWIDYFAENNLQILQESMGEKNMTLSEKIDFLSEELIKIGSDGNKLTIIDAYIFPKKRDDDYVDIFKGIVNKSKITSLKILTKKSSYDNELRNKIESAIHIPMTVLFSEHIHDRWWIIEDNNRGFHCGTSLNGVGKDKLTSVTPLDEEDIAKIISNHFSESL